MIQNIFTKSIFKINLQNLNYKKQVKEVLNNYKKNNYSRIISNVNGFQSILIEEEDFQKQSLDFFKDSILNFIKSFDPLCNFFIELNGIWINENFTGSLNSKHLHPQSNFSGVYYIKVPENSGDIIFYRDEILYDYLENYKIFNSSEFNISEKIEIKEDDLILFPSFLNHSVEKNLNKDSRISVAFNFNLKNL
jgi:uncharacterized protein (TIGR02466 family)